jgi:hypothetical protein
MENMLIGVSRITNRLRYIFDLLMVEQLGIGYSFTTDRTVLEAYEGPRLVYSNQPIEGIPFLQSVNLLFEREIVSQEFKTFEWQV